MALPLPGRRSSALLSAASLLMIGLLTLPAQPPADKDKDAKKKPPAGYQEVEEATPPAVKKRVIVEDEAVAVDVPKGAYYVRLEDLARQMVDAKNPALRAVYQAYVVAFDRITDTDGKTFRCTPIPVYRTDVFPEQFGVFPLDERNEPSPARSMDRAKFQRVEHYEELAAKEAADLATEPPVRPGIPRADRLAAAEHLLAAAAFFHDAARDQSKRKGRGWEGVRQLLADRLSAARLNRLKFAAENKDWRTVRSLGGRMAQLYPTNQGLLAEVFVARLAEALFLATSSDQPADLDRARELVGEFEARFPGSKSDVADRIRAALKEKAKGLFARAEGLQQRDPKESARLLRIVEAIDPNYPGLRDLKIDNSLLFVGTKRLPARMTPLTARSDDDLRAVELVFEGLLEAVPDEPHGLRFRPALAAGLPLAGAMGREFDLLRQAEWVGASKDAREYLTAADVAGTLKALRSEYRHTWPADGTDWLSEQVRVDDAGRVRVNFATGHPHPLALLTTKILPARWLAARNLKHDNPGFAHSPVGTGPYRYVKTVENQRVEFAANPGYARRPGRIGQPFIKEIYFVNVTGRDPLAEFKAEQLHILTDVPTADLRKYADPALAGRVEVVTAAVNRRVHTLVFNYRRPALRSVPLRVAIARAIDRDEVLNKVYRPDGQTNFHAAMTGPFPPNSWADYRPLKAAPPPLFEPNLSRAKFAEHVKKDGGANLRLLVPNDDPQAVRACDLMKRQIEAAGQLDEGRLQLSIEEVPPADFFRRVHDEGTFDLAYLPVEYPDDLYPFGLGAFLDPAAVGPGGRNLMGYLVRQNGPAREDDLLWNLLVELRLHADFAGRLVPQTARLHQPFIEAMPFVPLWQLDRHMVVSKQLKVFFDDSPTPAFARWLPPTTLFAGVARWKLE